jgi:glutaminase
MGKKFFIMTTYLVYICLIITSTSLSYAVINIDIKQGIKDSYQKFKNVKAGKNADYIPELAKVNPSLFGIAITTTDGNIQAIENNPNHLQNPMVNAGAIQVTSFIKGSSTAEKWERALDYIRKLSDGKPYLGEPVYKSETATNLRNQAISRLMNAYGMMASDPMDALERYTKACSIMVATKQLVLIGATLANNGTNLITHKNVLPPEYVHDILSEMALNGLYETSGEWWVISVRAQEVIRYLSKLWGLHFLDQK